MRRPPSRFSGASSLLIGAAVVVVATVVVGPAAAFAEDPTPTPSVSSSAGAADPYISAATPGEAVCTLSSTALDQITGMVATDKGIYVVEGGDGADPATVVIHTVDATNCQSTSKNYGFNPIDPEDLALGANNTLWVGDFGDNTLGSGPARDTVALEKVTIGGTKAAVPYRLTYAKGGKFDAEAMLLDKDDLPIIFTQEGGKAGIYKANKALVPDTRSNLPVLEKVGDFTPQKTGTANQMGVVGQSLVTGAAKSPDGKSVVIRTRSDAYEFTVGEDGDVVKAIIEGKPVITRLPNEPQGEAISYSADGSKFLTISVKPKGATGNPKLLSYTRHVPDLAEEPTAGDELPAAPGAGQSWFDKLSFSELTRIVAAVGVVGLVLAISGIVGIRRARKRRREEEDEYDYDDYDDDPRGRGRRGRGGRDREDEHSFSGLRDSRYADGYDQYGGGYADAGYGSNGYAGNGYGGGYADAGYGGAHAGQAHGADAYGGAQYGADPYGQQYAAPQYGAPQYGDQSQYGAPQADYGAYGGQQPAADYGGQQHYGADYGGQAQGQHGSQYGGYGYEEDFDPMQDPRRR